MSDKRSRSETHDTGSPTARARDDLRTATVKGKPNSTRNEKRDKTVRRQNKAKPDRSKQ